MDRETLVLRNKGMAEAFHQPPLKHTIRRGLLKIAARIPISRTAERGTQRVLLIRPDHLGDVLLATPALRELRQAFPQAELHALVGEWSAEVLAYFQDIDFALTLPFPGFRRAAVSTAFSPYQLALTSARKLRHIGYQAAVILRPDHWWGALICFLAGIPVRIGYAHPDVAPFLTDALPVRHEHVVVQNARLVRHYIAANGQVPQPGDTIDALPLTFPVNEADRGAIDDELYARAVADDTPLIVIHPGGGTWIKRWEAHKWAQTADALADTLDARIVFTGGDHERDLVREIEAAMRHDAVSLVGETSIGGLAALYQRARIVLGVDSGPMHLAAAVGKPTVTLFGAADPVEFGTWGAYHRHPMLFSDIGCRPCRVLDWGSDDPTYHPCVREISVARVLEAANRALHDTANRG
ncbi:MAG: glycosyltransferase family 9 protein [bacterium]|nr:glycosyltransferase family 9 protein [bacterium]